MNTTKIRTQFPFLKRKYAGQSLAYLDNASTTQKPQVVLDALVDAYQNHYANIHRAVYDLSVEATDLYENTRTQVRDLIGAKSEEEVIFTRNTTESINLLAYTLESALHNGDEILLTQMEHHSNIVPWQMLSERLASSGKRLEVKYVPISEEGRLDLNSVDKLLSKKTKIVSLTLMSNVLGTINPVKEIIKRVHKLFTVYHLPAPLVLIDAAQATAHMKVDVADLGCDFLVFSAHKMYGPAGVGVLWGRYKILEDLPPFMGGGDMILSVDFDKSTFNEVPYKFEAGTPSIADVIAFGEAIDFVGELGFAHIRKHEMNLTKYALEKLSGDPFVTLYGPHSYSSSERSESRSSSPQGRTINNRGPVISFNIDGVHPHDVASILSDQGVAIRSGHHCAQPLMRVLGIAAACRVSFGVYNTEEDVDRLIEGIEKVKATFKLNQKSPASPSEAGRAKVKSQNYGSSRLRSNNIFRPSEVRGELP